MNETVTGAIAIKDRTQQPIVLNNAIHEFEAIEKKVFYVVLNQIKKGMGVDQDLFNESLWFDVPTKLVGLKNYDRIKELVEGLTSRKIRLLDKKGSECHVFVPFPEIKYQKRWGHMKVRILDTAYPYLAELKDGYYWYQLKSALMLSKKFSQRFYEWFCQYLDIGVWKNVPIDAIRLRLAISPKEYKRNNDFMRRVIHDSIEEINNKTDIHVEIIQYHKKGQKVIGFDFRIKTKKSNAAADQYRQIEEYYDLLNGMNQKEMSQFLNRIKKDYKISDAWFNLLFAHRELLEEVIKVDTHIQSGKVEVKTTLERYMNGAIKKKMRELRIS